jgi:hypothetical protein
MLVLWLWLWLWLQVRESMTKLTQLVEGSSNQQVMTPLEVQCNCRWLVESAEALCCLQLAAQYHHLVRATLCALLLLPA